MKKKIESWFVICVFACGFTLCAFSRTIVIYSFSLSNKQNNKYISYILYYKCQAIHARSMLPCVDAPGHKSTYSAQVSAPAWATVLMSAVSKGEPTQGTSSGESTTTRVFNWEQPVACSSYLIAIAVGELESREISNRCRIWRFVEISPLYPPTTSFFFFF
jgi:aminopeptidase N